MADDPPGKAGERRNVGHPRREEAEALQRGEAGERRGVGHLRRGKVEALQPGETGECSDVRKVRTSELDGMNLRRKPSQRRLGLLETFIR